MIQRRPAACCVPGEQEVEYDVRVHVAAQEMASEPSHRVIARPSVSGECYRWNCNPQQAPLCALPRWIAQLLDQPTKAKSATEWRTLRYWGEARCLPPCSL